MHDVFLSYASEDRNRVAPLVEALERRGWSVWWDRRITGGSAYDREIEEAIDSAGCVVVAWSEHSVESDWVRSEAGEGLERGVLVPFALDPVRPPLAFRRTQTIDARAPDAMAALTEAVSRVCPAADTGDRVALPLVGRATEIERIDEALAAACEGRGSLLLLAGEAGAGKTRLAHEAARRAEQREMLVLIGRCQDTAGAPPYQPLIEQLSAAMRRFDPQVFRDALGPNAPEIARLMPELALRFTDIGEPPELPPDQERRYLLHGCADFIERSAANRPLLLVFEDLHWARESTCQLLRFLAERLRGAPVLLIGTCRDTDLDPGTPFEECLDALARARLLNEIPVRDLSIEDVAVLLESRAGIALPAELIALVHDATEGNPFFVEELWHHLEESGALLDADGRFRTGVQLAEAEVPRGVRLTIEFRLAKLDDATRRVLAAAAVIGRQFSWSLLAKLDVLDEEALLDAVEAAQAASLVEEVTVGREAHYQFRHELIRQTLLQSLALPRRQRLHQRIADVIAPAGSEPPADLIGEVARHLYLAGAAADPERTRAMLLATARRDLAAAAFGDALEKLSMLVDCEPGADELASAEGMRAVALRGHARIDDALGALDAGIRAAESIDIELILRFQRARLLVDLYRAGEALGDLDRVLEHARAGRDEATEISAQQVLADAHYKLSLDQPEHALPAREACERTIELCRAAGDQQTLARSLCVTAHFVDYWADYREQAEAHVREAEAIADELGDEDLQLDCETMRLRMSIFLPQERAVLMEEIYERLEARRDPIRLKEYLFWMIVPTRDAGHLERSIEVCDHAIELAARLGVPPVQYPTFKAIALLALGRFGEAWASADEEVHGEGYRFGAALQQLGYLSLRAAAGDVERVFADAPGLLQEFAALNRVWMVAWAAVIVMRVAARFGRMEEAERITSEAGVQPDSFHFSRAERLLAHGSFDAAIDVARKASEFERAMGKLLIAHEGMEVIARAHLLAGEFAAVLADTEETVAFCTERKCMHLAWQIRALRCQALAGLGDADAARRERAAGRDALETMARTIEPKELRAMFLAQPGARELMSEEAA